MIALRTCVVGFAIALGLWPPSSWADEPTGDLRSALYRRFQPSRIELATPGRQGAVSRQGKLLVLAVDGVPAKPFRVVQASPKSPWFHVMDFARVEITREGSMNAESSALKLDRGSRLVVLDVKLDGDRLHLLTHTAEPVAGAFGAEPVYGCTEFIFDLEPDVVRAGRADVVVQNVEQWLQWFPGERVCAPGVDQLCIEP